MEEEQELRTAMKANPLIEVMGAHRLKGGAKSRDQMSDAMLQKYVEHLLVRYNGLSEKKKKGLPKYFFEQIEAANSIRFYRVQTILSITEGLLAAHNKRYKYGSLLSKLLDFLPEKFSPGERGLLVSGIAVVSQIQSAWFDEEKEKKRPLQDKYYTLRSGGVVDAGILTVRIREITAHEQTVEFVVNKLALDMLARVSSAAAGISISPKVVFALYKIGRYAKYATLTALDTYFSASPSMSRGGSTTTLVASPTSKFARKLMLPTRSSFSVAATIPPPSPVMTDLFCAAKEATKEGLELEKVEKCMNESKVAGILARWEVAELARYLADQTQKRAPRFDEDIALIMQQCSNGTFAVEKANFIEMLLDAPSEIHLDLSA